MTDDVERRVAKALAVEDGAVPDAPEEEPPWICYEPAARAALTSLRPGDEINGCVLVPLKLLGEAHAVMRACGWQLAPAAPAVGDGVLALAAAEIEEKIGAMLAAEMEG